MKPLRKISFTTSTQHIDHNGDIDNVSLKYHSGKFHKFVGGYMSATSAIIETDDGKKHEIPVRHIKFIDDANHISY